MAIQLPQYPTFEEIAGDPTAASSWNDWLDGFKTMITDMQITKDNHKRVVPFHYLGNEGLKLSKQLENTGDDDTFDEAITAFTSYFSLKMS